MPQLLKFTFQYGSIQMGGVVTIEPDDIIYIPIWFYSNVSEITLASRIQSFTFQYGSIQISVPLAIFCLKFAFTFQYGSIQINSSLSYIILSNIYIPIWFYSNFLTHISSFDFSQFTFQYGSIQIYGTYI